MDNTNTLVISLVRKAVNPDYLIDKAVRVHFSAL